MAYTQSDNSGSAFRNERKREGKKDADFAGSGMIDGREYWIDIWAKNARVIDGAINPDYDPAKKSFFSFSFRPKDKPAASKAPPARRAAPPRPPSQEPDHSLGNERNF